jgi:hypothetical protein
MTKIKKKLTNTQKAAKKQAKLERQKKYEWVFMSGKQVRVKRQPFVEGIPLDEFISQHADPLWLHQNEMWELIDESTSEDSNFTFSKIK